jgi:hypothetical protein
MSLVSSTNPAEDEKAPRVASAEGFERFIDRASTRREKRVTNPFSQKLVRPSRRSFAL